MFETTTKMLVTDVGAESIVINIAVAVNKIFVMIGSIQTLFLWILIS